MKPYQTPEILFEDIDIVDILTTSFVGREGVDGDNEIIFWG